MTKQHAFQAEVSEVLSLVVNSLYTHKEVFLRELISNASDAIDQLAFKGLTDASLLAEGTNYRIDLIPDKDAKTLTISDNGVGMDEETLVRNLGTIAHSGTKKLLQSLSQDERQNLNLIGQFGVGFYSAFLVAGEVTVISRPAGGTKAWKWTSDGKGGFTVEEATREGRGTDVILKLRDDQTDFLREWTIRELVRKYSDFVRHPIRLRVVKEEDGKKSEEFEQVNRGAALWTRPKSEVTDEQYTDFYKHVTHDWERPLAWTHFKVEGTQELSGLLFIPQRAGLDLGGKRGKGVRLFVRRVFIMDDCEDLLPEYLRFMRGVVDSDDLPLNVSREFLQRDRMSTQLRKHVVRKVLDLIEELAAEGKRDVPAPEKKGDDDEADLPEDAPIADRYAHFWEQYGRILCEGVVSDSEHAERIQKLLRFRSSHGEGLTSLPDYVKRMKDGQTTIYYVTAETASAAAASPHAETLRKRGYEVLFAIDPDEEWTLQNLREFDGKKVVAAGAANLDLPEDKDAKEENEKKAGALAGLVTSMKDALSSQVKDVRVSTRLADSPACLVHEAWEASPRLERLLRANDRTYTSGKRILEVNADHPFIAKLNDLAGDTANAERVRDLSALLYDQALVAEGSPPSDPARFARQVAEMMRASVGG